MTRLSSLYSQLTNRKPETSHLVVGTSSALRHSNDRLFEVPLPDELSSSRRDRNLYAPNAHKAISPPSKSCDFLRFIDERGRSILSHRGVYNLQEPLGTYTGIYHHFTSSLQAAFTCAFASQAFSWLISCRTRILLCTPHSYSFILYSTKETIKGFAFLRICHPFHHLPLKFLPAIPPAPGCF
jgi:hypothetical protein